jgi:predicted secreted protein
VFKNRQIIKNTPKNNKDKPLVGAGGSETWTFKVQKEAFKVPRVSVITLTYMRPWPSDPSSEADADNSTEFKIIINPGKTPKSKNKF